MNEDFACRKSDLMGSPIKEWIKEQFNEDEEEDAKEELPEVTFQKHNTFNPRPLNCFEESPLFWFNNKANDLNLDYFDKPWNEFPMDIDDGLAPWNSLNFMNENFKANEVDKIMDQSDDAPYSMDVVIEDNYYPVSHNFISSNMLN